MTSISKIALACAALVAASGAFAQKAGDNIVSAGIASVNTKADVGTLTNNGGLSPYLVGTSANISSETTVSFSWLHMYSDNIGAEFTFGIPPRVTQDLTVPLLPPLYGGPNHPAAAKISIWTPTAVAKYFFATPQDQIRPYLGLGVTRASFHNVSINSGDAAIVGLAGTSANLSSSWAPVYNAGVIYNIDDKWSVNGSVSYIPVKTTATFVGTDGTTTGDIKLKATDYVIRLGYRF
jgi:outer membrane protein